MQSSTPPFIRQEQYSLYVLLGIALSCICIFYSSWESLVSIWLRSDTYAHGLIVFPVSIWLVWRNKPCHAGILNPQSRSWLGLLFLISNGLLWLMASIIDVLVIQQYALIGILVGSLWFWLGNKASQSILFPLVFLYLMVPVGENFLPGLMILTADISVALLKLTGITVYREGLYIFLTSGDWQVVEACSGLRYLIATITLGIVYAYITYTKFYKRLIFSLLSVLIPLISNGVRAYIIIMIGHFSNMELAVGVDHLIYGAVFFGIIIFAMFYVGSFWKDPESANVETTTAPQDKTTINISNCYQPLLLLAASFLIWPVAHFQLKNNYNAQTQIVELAHFSNNNAWQKSTVPSWLWQPRFNGVENETLDFYQNNEGLTVGVYQANFGNEKQGSELVNSRNVLVNDEQTEGLRVTKQTNTHLNLIDTTADLTVLDEQNTGNEYFTVKWYQLGSFPTNKGYFAKLYQLFKRLTLNTSPEVYTVIFTQSDKYDLQQKALIEAWLKAL